MGTIQISGEFLDHLPAFELLPKEALDPGPNEFRIFSPILIKDNQVIANMTGALGRDDGTDPAVILYVPQEERFVFAPIAFDGAVPATLQQNQISFTVDGKVYLLTTAAPISRSQHVWVLHQPDWRPARQESAPADDSWLLASGKLHALLSK